MTKKIIFHIGLHKTATTSLQVDTFPKIRELNYLPMQLDPVRTYINHVLACDPIYYPGSTKAAPLKAHFVANKVNLVSSESLSGPAWVGVAQRGIDHRSPVLSNLSFDFKEAEILLILRRQDGYARSMYRQYIKSGGTFTMARFLGSDLELGSPLFSLDRFSYSPYVDALQRHFDGKIHVMFFEELLADSAKFFGKLSTILDCSSELPIPGNRNSSRLGSRGLALSRLLNRIFRGPLNPGAPLPGIPVKRKGVWVVESPVSLIQDHWPGKSPEQSESERTLCAALLERSKADNIKLAELVNQDLGKLGYY